MTDTLVLSTSSAVVNASIASVDISDWLFGLSDGEYQACSPDHIAAACNRLSDGRRVSVNVEMIGGDVLVQRYVEEIGEKTHCRVRSTSDVFHRLGPAKMDVTWDLALKPISATTCELVNTIVVRNTPEMQALLEANHLMMKDVISQMQSVADLHNSVETPRFARNLSDKASGMRPESKLLPSVGTAGRVLADTTARAVVDAPLESIDLPEWLFALSEEDYRACSPAHISAGIGGGHAPRLSINVEAPGSLVVQHYQEVVTERHHCVVVSPRSDVFLGNTRSTLHVTWELTAKATGDGRSELVNHVVLASTPEFDAFLEAANVPFEAARESRGAVVAAHNAEETPLFALDIARKAVAAKSLQPA